jgi:hypothetical protein
MADVIQKINSGQEIRYGDAILATGAKRGAFATQVYDSGGISYSGLDTTFESGLDHRFDDPTYYTA